MLSPQFFAFRSMSQVLGVWFTPIPFDPIAPMMLAVLDPDPTLTVSVPQMPGMMNSDPVAESRAWTRRVAVTWPAGPRASPTAVTQRSLTTFSGRPTGASEAPVQRSGAPVPPPCAMMVVIQYLKREPGDG